MARAERSSRRGEPSPRLLVVEDDAALRLALSDRLSSEGYDVVCANDGEAGYEAARDGRFDLIVLDVMLPKRDGFDVCQELRARDVTTPILMLTARGEVTDKVVGLDFGADDYLTKPFEFMELLARLRALSRRGAARASGERSFSFGDVVVDLEGAEVKKDGETVQLTAKEFQLLTYFLEQRGVALSRNEILDAVWGYDAMPTTRTVDVHVAWLRQKLEPEPGDPRYFLTLRGIGYKFTDEEDS